ncbi:MAG: AAA family ATPase, partial [Lactobacillus iners]|nr:AAA family ATPase [Lactobacillus iners]
LLMDKLLENTSKLLYIDDFDLLANEVNNLKKDNKVVIFDDKVSLTNMYTIEKDIANDLKRISDSNKKDIPYLDDDLNSAIKHVEQKFDISYDDTQKKAIKTALNNSISILTGGPGTGKTTIIRGILATLQEIDPPFLLAAPTGRAAKRMSELTGIDAKTIHRLLGLGISDLNQENMNELNGEILIVDEMSMVDMFLFKNLVSSIFQLKHIVFVGDKDQLPSVGPGNIFSDLIASSAFPTTKLSMIHRQSDDSSIVDLAHKINQNNAQANIFTKTPNYSFISCKPNSIADAIEKIVDIALEKGFCADDIQVLTAMYNGVSGINSLNDLLQNIMNPAKIDSKKVEVHNEIFRIG